MTISRPTGGSGVFLDVGSIYGHLPAERLPWVAFTADLYLTGGVRAGAAPFSLMRIDPRTGELAERIFQVARLAEQAAGIADIGFRLAHGRHVEECQ